MRRIYKTQPVPECLGLFVLSQMQLGYDILYENFNDKEALLQILIDEQHGLCAYTGDSITTENAHNEHLKPQSQCKAEVENNHLKWGEVVACDLHYENIVAALTVKGVSPYGANAKDDWYEPGLFVSPIDDDCEQAFQYTADGQITVRDTAPRPDAARETIQRLRLNGNGDGGGALVDNRKGFLGPLLFEYDDTTGDYTGPIRSTDELEQTRQRFLKEKDDGSLRRFAFVVVSVIEDLLP